tara:strand:- start:970 stop:2463 length:1494 start_codon:yes stop_codon:yes gene_type:complete
MAKPLQSIAIQAPAFYGLNTQDSPTGLTEQFALVADNCVIDQYGRIGARKGWKYKTTTNPHDLVSISEFIKADTTSEVISSSASAIFKGVETLVDITPAGYTVGNGQFKSVTLNNIHYMFSAGEDPLYYDGTTCAKISDSPHYHGTVPKGGIALASFGRLWVVSEDNKTIEWSDLIIGAAWTGGSTGSIDFSKVWSDGSDVITGLAAHNGFLIIFGSSQILVYQGASEPSTMSIADSIVGTGCIASESIQATGNDLLFLSSQGLKSFNRIIQEKSMPMRDVSKNVRTELTSAVLTETGVIKSVFNSKEAFYLLILPEGKITYCFDMRTPLEDGSHRATKWFQLAPKCLVTLRNQSLLFGMELGISEYEGYLDNSSTYPLNYFSNYLDFGASSNLKLLKNLKISVIGGNGTSVTLNWGYDYAYNYKKRTFLLANQTIAEYNIAEYGVGEFNAGILVNRPSVNASGGGQVVQLGVEAVVNDSPLSIQRLTAQAIIGRVI